MTKLNSCSRPNIVKIRLWFRSFKSGNSIALIILESEWHYIFNFYFLLASRCSSLWWCWGFFLLFLIVLFDVLVFRGFLMFLMTQPLLHYHYSNWPSLYGVGFCYLMIWCLDFLKFLMPPSSLPLLWLAFLYGVVCLLSWSLYSILELSLCLVFLFWSISDWFHYSFCFLVLLPLVVRLSPLILILVFCSLIRMDYIPWGLWCITLFP